MFFETLLEGLEIGEVLLSDPLPFLQTEHFLDLEVAVDPGTADHRAVVDPRHGIVANAVLAGFDLQ
ncbi:hypothetical protein D3C81_2283980 [compost metagenome]